MHSGFFYENKTSIEPYSPLKPTKVGYIFIWPNSVEVEPILAAVNHMTQAVVRVESKIVS